MLRQFIQVMMIHTNKKILSDYSYATIHMNNCAIIHIRIIIYIEKRIIEVINRNIINQKEKVKLL